MLHSYPILRIQGEDKESPQQYRLIGRTVQFTKDGFRWRTLSAEDVDLHLRLRTPVATWLEQHLQPLRKIPPASAFSGPERRTGIQQKS
jgi:hypothetical protein